VREDRNSIILQYSTVLHLWSILLGLLLCLLVLEPLYEIRAFIVASIHIANAFLDQAVRLERIQNDGIPPVVNHHSESQILGENVLQDWKNQGYYAIGTAGQHVGGLDFYGHTLQHHQGTLLGQNSVKVLVQIIAFDVRDHDVPILLQHDIFRQDLQQIKQATKLCQQKQNSVSIWGRIASTTSIHIYIYNIVKQQQQVVYIITYVPLHPERQEEEPPESDHNIVHLFHVRH
jgi:hypothetical protein